MTRVMLAGLLPFMVLANSDFDAGIQQGKAVAGVGKLGQQAPEVLLPGYTGSAPQAQYYGGVTAGVTDLTTAGNQALNHSETGQAVQASILATPQDNKPSWDAPFIQAGTTSNANAASMVGPQAGLCTPTTVTNSTFTSHTCQRDTQVDQYCARTASLSGYWTDDWKETSAEVLATNFTYQTRCIRGCGGNQTETTEATISFSVPAPVQGMILRSSISLKGASSSSHWLIKHNDTDPLNVFTLVGGKADPMWSNVTFADKTLITGTVSDPNPYRMSLLYADLRSGKGTLRLQFVAREHIRRFNPTISWSESCPFDKPEGTLQRSECIEPAATKTISMENTAYSLYSDCWQWRDTYLLQSTTEGTCGPYQRDPACTVAQHRCAHSLEGVCVSEFVTYSCQTTTQGSGQVCGGELFCADGSCANAAANKGNAFASAASSLAAVAAAGKDIADNSELSGNVSAFTGKPMYCKKYMAGFSNCCKSSGWGQDIGLSSCSSEEKAIATAKSKQVIIEIGEFCSKKALGVCLQKKRSYCVFDSKLAQIVQQQGRAWQLGIGFGGAPSPNCRGLTAEELQDINFEQMDFSNFFSELNSGSAIPTDQALLERAKAKLQQAGAS